MSRRNNFALKQMEEVPLGAAEPSDYVLLGGDRGAQRLKLLNSAYWPTTEILLGLAGVQEGSRFLDVGCGPGSMLIQVSKFLKHRATLMGVDKDPRVIEIARGAVEAAKVPATFQVVNVEGEDLTEPSTCDFVYTRSVLTHLRNPSAVIERMLKAVKPGGTLIVEDIEFTSSFSYPKCPEFYHFTELYQKAVKMRGADPNIGPKLYSMFLDAGVQEISLHVTQPTFFEGDGKKIAEVTLEHIRDAVMEAKLATSEEVDQAIRGLSEFAKSRETLLSFPRVFQLWGKKRR